MQVTPITTTSNLFSRRDRKRQAFPMIPEDKQTQPIAYWNGQTRITLVA